MRVAVTGGAGYIGSTLIRDLLAKDNEVTSIDNQTTGDYERVRRHLTGAKLLEGDIRESTDLDVTFRGADAVVHMAALSDLDACNEHPEEAISVNVYGTHQVVEAARRNHVRRLVFCSSAAVYGTPASTPVTERHMTHPLNIYGVTKLAGEKLLDAAHLNYGLEIVSLRFGNVYGVGLYTNWVGVIPKFIALALDGKSLTVYGDGTATRDFVHVQDITSAITLSLKTKKIGGKIFNIGNETTTVNDIAQEVSSAVEKTTGKRSTITHLPPREGETHEFSYNTEKIRTVLGFQPKWNLGEGIEQIVRNRLIQKS